MIYYLLLALIIEFIICYYIFDKDLFSPSAILCEVFILSTLACIYNIDNWGVNLHKETFNVIVFGNLVFILTAIFVHFIFNFSFKKKNICNVENKSNLKFIKITDFKIVVILAIYITFAAIYIFSNLSIIKSLSSGVGSAAMNIYRRELVEGMVKLPGWLAKLNVILNIGVFVLIYVFINNTIIDYKNKKNYIILFSILIYLFSSIFTAQRTTILLAFIYTLFVVYELLNRKYKLTSKINGKYIFKGFIVIILFFSLFALTRGLFGRVDKRTPIDNITYYIGNSIESLDLFIVNPTRPKQYGEELFRQFRLTLSKYGICEPSTMDNIHLEFRKDAKGNSAGNVYTAYRNYLHDFDFKSIIVFQIVISLFYSIWYEKIRKRKLKDNIDIGFIMYSWMILCLFRFSLSNSFFTYLSYLIFTHWYTFLVWKLFFNIKIKKNSIYYKTEESI